MKLDTQLKEIQQKYNKLINDHESNMLNMQDQVAEKSDYRDQLDALKAELKTR